MAYERIDKNPGSAEEFAAAHAPYFEIQGQRFAQEISVKPIPTLGQSASAEVIKLTNSQPPTPEA